MQTTYNIHDRHGIVVLYVLGRKSKSCKLVLSIRYGVIPSFVGEASRRDNFHCSPKVLFFNFENHLSPPTHLAADNLTPSLIFFLCSSVSFVPFRVFLIFSLTSSLSLKPSLMPLRDSLIFLLVSSVLFTPL